MLATGKRIALRFVVNDRLDGGTVFGSAKGFDHECAAIMFLGIITTSAGTLMFDVSMQSGAQWSFMLVAGVSVFLLLAGYFK